MFDFFIPLENLTQHNLPKKWAISEEYLNLGGKVRKIVSLKDKHINFQEVQTQKKWYIIALKIISYIAIIPLVIALSCRAYYRNKYKIQSVIPIDVHKRINLDVRKEINLDIHKEINEYRTKMDKIKKDLESKAINPIKILCHTINRDEALDYPKLLQELQICLKVNDLDQFETQLSSILKIEYKALNGMLSSSPTDTQVNFAKETYKMIAKFLRQHTNKMFLEQYKEYLKKDPKKFLLNEPSSYLFPADKIKPHSTTDQNVSALFFLLKHLRKQIKLRCKQDKIKSLVKANPVLEGISPTEIDKALPHLKTTWLHGTKAYAIKSACTFTDKSFLPFGELQRRNIKMLSGKQDEGSSSIGVNQDAISGVNLRFANECVGEYSMKHVCKIEDDKQLCQEFIKFSFYDYNDVNDCYAEKHTRVQAIKRIATQDPQYFAQIKPQLENKVKEIYLFLEEKIFANKKLQMFEYFKFEAAGGYNPYSKTAWGFYSFLEVLKQLKSILSSRQLNEAIDPADAALAEIPVVIASSNGYGFPVGLSITATEAQEHEELYPEKVTLGSEIQTIFVSKKDQNNSVQKIIDDNGLTEKVKVESLSVLLTAEKIDIALAPYLYDVFSVRKWEVTN